MKKTLLLLSLFVVQFSIAQCIVVIPDANFKNALLNHNPVIDTNGDGEIQCSEATAFTGTLVLNYKQISNLAGIESFTEIIHLYCSFNDLSSLDVSANTNLIILHCDSNVLTSLNISNNASLHQLICSDNQLTDLDVSSNTALIHLEIQSNLLTSLNVANGNNINFQRLRTASNANLTCIKVDNTPYSNSNWTNPVNFTKPNNASWSENCALSTSNFETFKVAVYPNPTNGIVNLSEMANVTVFDMQGRKIAESKNTTSCDLSSQRTGIYLAKITTEKGSETIKIVKQ